MNCFDIGAQSTAPKSLACSEKQEQERFEEFFFPHLDLFFEGETLSIDTYRPQTFHYIYRELQKLRPDLRLIFNDVSGVIDDELLDTLKKCPECSYIYSHTFVAKREQTPLHMEFSRPSLSGEEFLKELIFHFRSAEEVFIHQNICDRVIFDPCFGFSKTFEQNLFILSAIEQIFRSFPKNSWLIGISKKSFLQKLQPEDLSANEKRQASEGLHCAILGQVMLRWVGHTKLTPFFTNEKEQQLFIRIHDPLVYRNSSTYVREFFLK